LRSDCEESSARKSLSQCDGKTVLGSAPQVRSVLKREELFPALEYARNGTFLPSGVGGTECLPRSNRICSLFPACSAAIRARRVLLVHSGMTGKRSSTVAIISRFPPSSAIPRRSPPSLVGPSA